jgi:hypothetical protein
MTTKIKNKKVVRPFKAKNIDMKGLDVQKKIDITAIGLSTLLMSSHSYISDTEKDGKFIDFLTEVTNVLVKYMSDKVEDSL